ncbi:hypothetical protein JCGZ_12848 [Jatropha curcas]|uniref:NAC domain-containing protein n=1 Tax=Jatropha curcas TaxID=180498 RepID=A0A067KB81_JATCU|nr:hypothetical protein JCGZ_12848 [Jatropha curcas]
MLPGFRFDPTDEELAGHYLYKKLTGKPFVAECNDIWAPGGDECLTVGADRDEPMACPYPWYTEDISITYQTSDSKTIQDGNCNLLLEDQLKRNHYKIFKLNPKAVKIRTV